jgi:hypothetical protein
MEAQPVAGARDAQARTKKNKTSKPKHPADQARRSGQSEALMEATDVEVEEFEDDGNAWKSGQSPVTYLFRQDGLLVSQSARLASDPGSRAGEEARPLASRICKERQRTSKVLV